MSNYKQTDIAGEAWTRAKRVVIDNTLNQTPVIEFIEEKVISIDSEMIHKDTMNLVEPFSNPLQEFNVVNPTTGEAVRTATYAEVYELLHSLYLHLAIRRDAKIVEQD
jgi:hypothetical protein